jgi:hypothetical protein
MVRLTAHPESSSGLLEPYVATSDTYGSEGASAQQCAGATRLRRVAQSGKGVDLGLTFSPLPQECLGMVQAVSRSAVVARLPRRLPPSQRTS